MGQHEYEDARRLGKKEFKNSLAMGRTPYLPVLDEILSYADIQTEQQMGVVNVPLEFVVGTSTAGRTTSFASNFMPILDYGTEFGTKWAVLADIQMSEGIRDPIIAYEYMNRYYVVEGNKRVSVLKYFNAVSIPAIVTRKVPRLTDDEDIRLYYEFVDFQNVTGFNTIEFTVLGNAPLLAQMIRAKKFWLEAEKEDFSHMLFLFTKCFEAHGGRKLDLKIGDALVAFLKVYGYDEALLMNEGEINERLVKAWNEITNMTKKNSVDLIMDPAEVKEKKGFWDFLWSGAEKTQKVAFLYPKSPEQSDWIYGHELGRNYLGEKFKDELETVAVENISNENIKEVLNKLIADGCNIIFEVAPQVMVQSLKVAVEHPDVKILNCSLNTSHKYIRTYYARMYEAKFLAGMIAGAMAENDRIAYIADYPIYGMIANINAFAFGAQCVNPRAKVYLEWSTKKDFNLSKFVWENEISIVSDQDMITPDDQSRSFGLYTYNDKGERVNLVLPIWNWGIFYEKLIQSIISGVFDSEEWDERRPLNYWWGMSAGVIDLIASKNVPPALKNLIEHIKEDISKREISPFSGEIRDQEGKLRNQADKWMRPEDIMNMDWLVENIVGTLPAMEELNEAARMVVAVKGVE